VLVSLGCLEHRDTTAYVRRRYVANRLSSRYASYILKRKLLNCINFWAAIIHCCGCFAMTTLAHGNGENGWRLLTDSLREFFWGHQLCVGPSRQRDVALRAHGSCSPRAWRSSPVTVTCSTRGSGGFEFCGFELGKLGIDIPKDCI
jgi:hypothetical protein